MQIKITKRNKWIHTAIWKSRPRPPIGAVVFGSLSLESCFFGKPLSPDDFCDISRAKRPTGCWSPEFGLLILCGKNDQQSYKKKLFNKLQYLMLFFIFFLRKNVNIISPKNIQEKNMTVLKSNHVAWLFNLDWIDLFVRAQCERAEVRFAMAASVVKMSRKSVCCCVSMCCCAFHSLC